MLEDDGGHIKELYRRGQAHEQLGDDRLGLAMKDKTRLLHMWKRADKAFPSGMPAPAQLHQPSSTAYAHQRACWPRTCSSSASMRFP